MLTPSFISFKYFQKNLLQIEVLSTAIERKNRNEERNIVDINKKKINKVKIVEERK